jgi:hypothetical protein
MFYFIFYVFRMEKLLLISREREIAGRQFMTNIRYMIPD